MSEEQKKQLLEKLKKERSERMDKMVTAVLTKFFEYDLCFHTDPQFIEARVRQILSEMQKKLKPYSEKVTQARKELLDSMLGFAEGNIPKPEKTLAIDASTEQKKRCEPIVHDILKLIVTKQHMIDEDVFVEHVIADDDEALFESLLNQITESLFGNMIFAINQSIAIANKNLWGGQEINKRKFRQLDKVLKEGVKKV